MCRISNICCCFLQPGTLEKIKTNIRYSNFKIRHVQMDELPRTFSGRAELIALKNEGKIRGVHPAKNSLERSQLSYVST